MPTEAKYPCPCCGYLIFDKPVGSYQICPICFWEDDGYQLLYPFGAGANQANLFEAQQNYLAHGVSELRLKKHVRSPIPQDIRDPRWRILDLALDIKQTSDDQEYWTQHKNPDGYYWRWHGKDG